MAPILGQISVLGLLKPQTSRWARRGGRQPGIGMSRDGEIDDWSHVSCDDGANPWASFANSDKTLCVVGK